MGCVLVKVQLRMHRAVCFWRGDVVMTRIPDGNVIMLISQQTGCGSWRQKNRTIYQNGLFLMSIHDIVNNNNNNNNNNTH